MTVEDPWGIGDFRGGGGEKTNIKQIVKKKKIGEKIWKSGEIGKKSENIGYFFVTENGLKCIRNPTKHL